MTEWKSRRFWTQAAAVEIDAGFGVSLDGRPVRTPAKAVLSLPTVEMAEAIAAEWQAQGDAINPLSMPFTRAGNAAIDKVRPQQPEVARLLADYADADLTCYRADSPAALVERQAAAWDPLLDWAAETYGARLIPVEGVMHQPQNPASLRRLAAEVHGMDPFELTALSDLVSLSGSLLIGLAATRGLLPTEELWRRSRIDEDWQQELWGIDDEAARSAAQRKAAFESAWIFYGLAQGRPAP